MFFINLQWCLSILEYHYDAIDDFDKAIYYSNEEDANLYFGRGLSRYAVTDYGHAMIDLEHAIELSKLPTILSAEYNEKALGMGYSSAGRLYEHHLNLVKNTMEHSQHENFEAVRLELLKRRGIMRRSHAD